MKHKKMSSKKVNKPSSEAEKVTALHGCGSSVEECFICQSKSTADSPLQKLHAWSRNRSTNKHNVASGLVRLLRLDWRKGSKTKFKLELEQKTNLEEQLSKFYYCSPCIAELEDISTNLHQLDQLLHLLWTQKVKLAAKFKSWTNYSPVTRRGQILREQIFQEIVRQESSKSAAAAAAPTRKQSTADSDSDSEHKRPQSQPRPPRLHWECPEDNLDWRVPVVRLVRLELELENPVERDRSQPDDSMCIKVEGYDEEEEEQEEEVHQEISDDSNSAPVFSENNSLQEPATAFSPFDAWMDMEMETNVKVNPEEGFLLIDSFSSSPQKDDLELGEDAQDMHCDVDPDPDPEGDAIPESQPATADADTKEPKQKTQRSRSPRKTPRRRRPDLRRNRKRKAKPPRENQKKYVCKMCGQQFTQRTILSHVRSVHNRRLNRLPGGYLHPCDLCGKQVQNLKLHKLSKHTSSFTCSLCGDGDGSSFTSYPEFQYHQTTAHPELGLPPVKCDICSKEYLTAQGLRAHKRLIHRPPPPPPPKPPNEESSQQRLYCDQCPFTTLTHTKLANHVRVVHENTRPFGCRYCPWRLKSKTQLRDHEARHEGKDQAKFQCASCPKAFPTRGGLKLHEAGVHKKIDSGCQCACEVCGKVFPARNYLYHHRKSHDTPEEKETRLLRKRLAEEARIAAGLPPLSRVRGKGRRKTSGGAAAGEEAECAEIQDKS